MSIEYRGDSKYRFRVRKDGINYTQNFYGTEKEAEREHKKFEVDIMRGQIGTNENMLFYDLVELFKEEYMVNLRASSQAAYNSIAKNHLSKDFGNLPLSKIKTIHIQKKLNEKAKILAPSTVNAIYKEINKTFNKAIEWGIIKENPCKNIKLQKVKSKKYDELLSNDDIKRLITAINSMPIMFKTIFSIALYTGMRQGEILGLHLSDIDFTEKTINISKQNARVFDEENEDRLVRKIAETKTENSVRKIYTPDFLLDIIKAYINTLKVIPKDGALFFNISENRIYSREWIVTKFKTMLLKYSIPDIRFHDLRHLYATMALNNGINIVAVARTLGDTIETVLQNYTHGIEDLQKKATFNFENYI